MIKDEEELGVMQKRLEQFHFWLLDFRRNARSDEVDALASCYRLEIERMQAEILDYLFLPVTPGPAKQAA